MFKSLCLVTLFLANVEGMPFSMESLKHLIAREAPTVDNTATRSQWVSSYKPGASESGDPVVQLSLWSKCLCLAWRADART